jgi:hypothetical protein
VGSEGSWLDKNGADGHGLPGADLAGDDTDGAFADAPTDPCDSLVVRGVAVQHAGREIATEGHLRESVCAYSFSIEQCLRSADPPGGTYLPGDRVEISSKAGVATLAGKARPDAAA